ncbi:MAG: AarF/ABC1/UbiB kinase family protein [Candidatus Aureabacteria bacterium]|nr:AarF/ABC1/UbiB kinase family protein [Candidatus Auribacterota bacterium]NLW93388.1 AarF/ABC1/UbiB kinase family protein [Chlamydiota bacterium]HOE27736.1 AarF/ABC1/UbiB kinase family protein [bacterium]HQM51742.1 AarF/ABC1/UbiB kinase family protein [bacterium]
MRYYALIRRRGELVRLRQVMAVLFRHGFGHVVYALRLGEHVPFLNRALGRDEEDRPLTFGARLRLSFEELGPTFIKFGQLLSNRSDLVPPEVVAELTRLQDHAPAFPFAEVRETVIAELHRPPEELFGEFESAPMAAASIAQVHRATLLSGERVVVKVQRPGIQRQVAVDLNILQLLAHGLERYLPESRAFAPVDLVRFFRKTIGRELDFVTEGRNAARFRHNFAGEPDIVVPEVHWRLTTPRVLVMEDVEGVRVDDSARLDALGIDHKEIALKGARAFLKQVFEDRFFHADPHPGNFSVLPDGRLALVDFGMAGRLDGDLLEELAQVVLAVSEWDASRAARHLLRLRLLDEEIDEDAFRSDLAYMIESYAGRPLKDINLGQVLNETIYIAGRYRIRVPPDCVLLGKAVVAMENVGRRLDPEFDMVAAARDYARRYALSRFSPGRVKERVEYMAGDLLHLLRELPGDLQLIVRKATRGKLKLEFEHRGLDTFIMEMDRSSNRIAFGLVVAALIVGSSVVILSDRGPHLFGLPLLGLAGFVLTGLLGLRLIFGIMRSGKL